MFVIIDMKRALYSEANSFRGAERLGESLILPMASYFSAIDVQNILKVVQGNYQIYNASGTPAILKVLFEKTKQYLPEICESWRALFEYLLPKYSSLPSQLLSPDIWVETGWESLVNTLKAAGISIPPEEWTESF